MNTPWLDTLAKDLRYGARQLLRAPGFTLAAVLALGLGVGATTAIFSVLDAVVLRPLPYASPDRLVTLHEVNPAKGLLREPLSPVNFMDYRDLSQAFSDAAAWWRPNLTLTGEGQEPLRVNAVETSNNLFSVLGVRAARGAGFSGRAAFFQQAVREVVISDRLWRTRFNADPAIVGGSIRLDNRAYTVLGIMPSGFHFPEDTDVWTRLSWDLHYHSRGAHFMGAVARLRDGVTVDRAQTELTALTTRFATQFPGTNAGWRAQATPLHTEVVGFFRAALYILLGTVSLLLVIACVNVASLLLARSSSREREVAIRTALGATRGRVIRQLLTESGLLALTGAIAGIGIAIAGLRVLVYATPVPIPRLDEVTIDARVLAFALIVAAATAIAFGLAPAWFLARMESMQALKESGRGNSSSPHRERTRRLLVVAEVGLAVMLLFGAGLMIRTIANLSNEADLGFRPAPVLTASIQLTSTAYPKWEQVAAFYATLVDRVRESPEIQSAGAANFLPLTSGWRMPFLVRGRPAPARGDEPAAQHVSVTEGYFDTIGAPLVAGRRFDAHDTADAEPVVLINQALARQYFGGQDPVGQTIRSFATQIGPLGRSLMTNRDHRIIGIVGDVKNHSLQRPAEPAIFHAARQFPFLTLYVAMRGNGGSDPARLTAILRDALRTVDPAVPLSDVKTMSAVMGEATGQLRLLTSLMTGFAALALLLAIVGIYGMLAYAVSQRQQEISIRLALGATRPGVLWLVLRRGLMLSLTGAALGAVGALLVSRSLQSFLYGVQASDAVTLLAVVAIVMGVAAAACALPARRASAVDPLAGLRGE